MASFPFPTNSPFSAVKANKIEASIHAVTGRSTKFRKPTQKSNCSYTSHFRQISSLCREGLLAEAFFLLTEMETENFQIGPDIYGEVLQGCLYERAVAQGQQIHARIIKSGSYFCENDFVATKLVLFYAKCGLSTVAMYLFTRLRNRSVFSWAAIIGLHCGEGSNEKALLYFCQMLEDGVFPDNFVIPNAVKACSALNLIGCGKAVHGYSTKVGFDSCVFVASSLVDMYGKCGIVEDARKVFEEIPEKTVISWNSIIVSHVQNEMNLEAMELFNSMRVEGLEPTRVTVSSFLSASANTGAVDEGRQGHALAVLCGLELDNIMGSALINFYSKTGGMEDAELIFNRLIERDLVTWNLMVTGYVQDGQLEKAIHTCQGLMAENLMYDSVTLSSILTACADARCLNLGRSGHGYCIRHNCESDLLIVAALMEMYAKCEKINEARCVFNTSTYRIQSMWNTLLSAYAQAGQSGEALKLLHQMDLEGVPANVVSYNFVISGLFRDGRINEARDLFSEMQPTGLQPNLHTWNIVISGLAQNGYGYEAIQSFQQMQEVGFSPDEASFVGLLSAYLNLALISYGKAIHGFVMRHGLCSCVCVTTYLAKSHAKCRNLPTANMVFDPVLCKELLLCNTMV